MEKVFVPAYTASKHAVAGLTKALANEWAVKGVHVNAIAPGYIDTNNTEALRNDPDRSKSILDRIPAGRWGASDDIAGATVFLASRAARSNVGPLVEDISEDSVLEDFIQYITRVASAE